MFRPLSKRRFRQKHDFSASFGVIQAIFDPADESFSTPAGLFGNLKQAHLSKRVFLTLKDSENRNTGAHESPAPAGEATDAKRHRCGVVPTAAESPVLGCKQLQTEPLESHVCIHASEACTSRCCQDELFDPGSLDWDMSSKPALPFVAVQYYCAGYSTYPTDGNDSKGSSGAGLMPYCEGLEVSLVLGGWLNADRTFTCLQTQRSLVTRSHKPGQIASLVWTWMRFGWRSALVWVTVLGGWWDGLSVTL